MAWTEKETLALIEEWGDERIQEQLEGCTRNKAVYEKVARALDASGHNRTAVQCREKIKKLKKDYRKIKDHNGKTGRGRKKWAFYDKMDGIMRDKHSTTPPVVVDTSAEVICAIQEDCTTINGEERSEVSDVEHDLEEDGECIPNNETSPDHTGTDDLFEKVAENTDPKNKGKKDGGGTTKSGRTRLTRTEAMEKSMKKTVAKIAKLQEESDLRYLEVEEKRLKFEERMLEMEEKRQKENREQEIQHKREEREFQFKVHEKIIIIT